MCKKRCKCSVLKQLRLHCVNSLTLLMSMLIDNVLIEVYFCHLSKQYLIKNLQMHLLSSFPQICKTVGKICILDGRHSIGSFVLKYLYCICFCIVMYVFEV